MSKDQLKVVNSSLIRSYLYDAHSMELVVNFMSDSSTDHVYSNVDPATMSKVFDSPGSIGAKFHKLIVKAGGYKHAVKQQEDQND